MWKIHLHYLFIYSVHRKNVISQLYAQIKKKRTSEWFEANEGYINENNIYLNVIFGILFVGVASNKFLVWHFELTKSLSRYCISYCDLNTTIHKWEKYHWIWHHIIHPSRQVTLMWNIFFWLVVQCSILNGTDVCDLSMHWIGWLMPSLALNRIPLRISGIYYEADKMKMIFKHATEMLDDWHNNRLSK